MSVELSPDLSLTCGRCSCIFMELVCDQFVLWMYFFHVFASVTYLKSEIFMFSCKYHSFIHVGVEPISASRGEGGANKSPVY